MARSKVASSCGTCSAWAWTRGKSMPNSRCMARAVVSWRREMSTPTGRAPARASQAET
nr:hypothetical protein [Saccharothrix australiensis]